MILIRSSEIRRMNDTHHFSVDFKIAQKMLHVNIFCGADGGSGTNIHCVIKPQDKAFIALQALPPCDWKKRSAYFCAKHKIRECAI